MVTEEKEDVDHLPLADEDTEVYCLSQIARKLNDPVVGDRDCVLADQGGTRPWKGSLLPAFMKEVTSELKEHIGDLQQMSLFPYVVFEAYKILEEDFSVRMQSVLGMSVHRKFVGKFRKVIAEAAKVQSWRFSLASSWIEQKIPFGVFVQAILLLLDAVYNSENGRLKGGALLSQGLGVFQEILEEVLKDLREDYIERTVPSPEIVETLVFMMEPANTEAVVREFAACSSLRHARNGYSHPFSPIASKAVRETAMNLYTSLLSNDFTKDFRHVAVMGRVKLELLEFSKKEKMKVDMDKGGERFLSLDSGSDSSNDDPSPKFNGLWED